MDAAEPPRIVFEAPAPCSDGERAEALLRRALAVSHAPAKGWSVKMRVDRVGPRSLEAEGDISDGNGLPIAHRVLKGDSDCSGLARALGVWASLVLDAQRARTDAPAATATAPSGTPAGAMGDPDPAAPDPEDASGGTGADAMAKKSQSTPATPASSATTIGWPPPADPPKPSPEHDWYLHHDEARTVELGAGGFLMTGEGDTALAGGTAFAVIEVGDGIFLRPAFLFGKSVTTLPPQNVEATLFGGRVDACLRLPGLYTSRRGMQLDACGGSDFGALSVPGMTRGTLGFGPSMDLRGELGGALSAALRGVFDVNAVRPTLEDPLLAGRVELAFSWRLR